MACTIKVDFTRAASLKNLSDYCGTNCTMFYSYLTSVFKDVTSDGNLEFTDDFKKFVGNIQLDVNNMNGETLKNKIIEFYNNKYASVYSAARETRAYDKVLLYGYGDDGTLINGKKRGSIAAREDSKKIGAEIVISYFHKNENQGLNEKLKDKRDFYKSAINHELEKFLYARLGFAAKKSVDEIKKELETESIGTLLDKYNVGVQLRNLAAFYIEFNANEDLFNEILYDSRLSGIKFDAKSEDDEQTDTAADEALQDEDFNTEDTSDETEYDVTIRVLDNKLGAYTDYMTHVGANIKALLGSIKKLNDGSPDGKLGKRWDYDLDNNLSLPMAMNANECATVLYHYGDYTSPELMMESIKRIATTLPGFAGFHMLHDILKGNKDLQADFYRTFGKTVIGKLETVVKDGKTLNRISNNTSSKIDALRFEYLNSVKTSSVQMNIEFAKSELENLKVKFRGFKAFPTDKKYRQELEDMLYKQLKRYYSNIDPITIRNYLRMHNQSDVENINVTQQNAQLLITLLEQTVNASANTQQNYRDRQAAISVAFAKNKRREQLQEETGEYIGGFEDMNALYSKPFIDEGFNKVVVDLATLLSPYSLVKVDLNSVNIHGNQSSDVINSSMITNIMKTLTSALNTPTMDGKYPDHCPLVNLGEYRFKSQQYDFSNIMLEHRTENGDVIYGLFRETEDGKRVPTEYATDLLRFNLFNGSSNLEDDNSVLYAEMSKGDYIGTAWINFFTESKNSSGINTADYFLRIPSDAPKTFTCRAPKYSVKGLFQIINQKEINDKISAKIQEIDSKLITSLDDIKDVVFANRPVVVSKNGKGLNKKDFIKQVTSDEPITIRIPSSKKSKKFVNGSTVSVMFAYKSSPNDELTDNNYVMEGTIKIDDEGKVSLTNVAFKGFVETEKTKTEPARNFNGELWSDIRESLFKRLDDAGEVQRSANTKHVIFQAFRNAFLQELTDAATAVDVIFDTKVEEDGSKILGLKKGKPAIKKNYAKDTNGLSTNYHLKKNTYVTENSKGERVEVKTKGIVQDEYVPVLDENNKPKTNKYGEIIYQKSGKQILSGNVFHSDRFIIYDREGNETTNYGEKILEEAFDFFYGGAPRHNFAFRYKTNDNGKLEVILSAEQEQVIEKYLNQFISDYIENIRDRLSAFNGFIKGTAINTDNIAEFILNHHLMYINFNDLLEGDTKYYKSSQDFLKRAKESQGSGVPYGIVDFTERLDAPRHQVPSALESLTFGPKGYKVEQFNRFRAVTVKNTVKTDTPMLEQMVKILTDKNYMGENVLTEDRARDLMYGPIDEKDGKRKGGYQQVTVNDAQSYITFDEWVRRIAARGQINKYKPLIDKILNEDELLTVNDIEQFVQVQKNFYYDQYYNPETRTVMPRQIKNAEFVLVPRLIKGTQLEVVYKLMQKYGIDQLNTEETSKAGKSYILEVFDEKTGDVKQDIIDEFVENSESTSEFGLVAKDATELFNYNYLYTQQETPQHINAKNKAGIQVVKKLFDNIPEDSPLAKYKHDFFEQYSNNIIDSFQTLMEEFDIELDDNGNIKLNKVGEINKINYEKFYERLREELARLGMDSNMIDYCTQSGEVLNRDTVMPNYMSLVAVKLENIAQSLFNSRITRQTLPGFHAAQVTGVGFQPLSAQVDNVLQSGDLKYHPNGEPYIEVMLPAANFGFDRSNPAYKGLSKEDQDRAFLSQLRAKGLDMIIGYRIPTEGKQSACNMKVVGFTDDALGSTIVVPDAWVAQTGSDFDIDSVYGIQYNTYIDKDGSIHKVQYYDTYEKPYFDYVRRNVSKEEWNRIFEYAKLEDDEIKEIKQYVNYWKRKDPDAGIDYNTFIDELKASSRKILAEEIERLVKEHNLMSFKDFSKQSISKANSRQARENKILDDMIEILSSPEALEENLSRSNFDDVLSAFDKCMTDAFAKERASRSPYNFFDQAEYQEDAMSGAKLKAFSVTRDTMVSVCNTVRPTLSDSAKVSVIYSGEKYSEDELVKRFGKDNVEKVGKNFKVTHTMFGWSLDNKNIDGKILTAYSSQTTAHILDAIKSGNIPNVNDLTFQVYKTIVDVGSNYDTAVSFMMQPGVRRIVDAYNSSKSIYAKDNNRNYIGTAIREIATELGIDVAKNAKIDDILAEINSEYEDIINAIFGVEKTDLALNDDDIGNLALNPELQLSRLQGVESFAEGTPVEEMDENRDADTIALIYDLCVILQYNRLNNLARKVGDLARVCNPDKFGAKQTIFATNDIFDQIATFDEQGNIESGLLADENFPLLVNGKHFIDAIYPGIRNGLDAFIQSDTTPEASAYPPLFTFLKYATASSIKVNKKLFVTQETNFVEHIRSLQSLLAGGQRIDEKTYKAFQNYFISYLSKRARFINQPLHFSIEPGGKYGFDYLSKDNGTKNEDEFERVYGYGCRPDMKIEIEEDYYDEKESKKQGKAIYTKGTRLVEFTVKNINNPTQEEINLFEKFSPAQKVYWLQQNLREGEKGVLEHIRTSLFNDRMSRKSKYGAQTMEFAETTQDKETLYADFELGFSSRNPLIALTHADILKYAFIVEGYKMGRNNVSKLIKNSVLVNGGKIYGTNIVNDMNREMALRDETLAGKEFDALKEDFLRSHPNIKGLNRRYVKWTKNGYDLIRRASGIIQIGNTKEGEEILEKYGFGYKTTRGDFKTNKYGNLTFGNKTTLYKLINDRNGSYFLIPLNKLEENENGEWSANPANNVYPAQDYYLNVIDNWIRDKEKDQVFTADKFKESAAKVNVEEYKAPKQKELSTKMPIPLTKADKDTGFYDHLGKEVANWLKTDKSRKLIIVNGGLDSHIKANGEEYGLTDGIVVTEKDNRGNDVKRALGTFKIYRHKDIKWLIKTYVLGDNAKRDISKLTQDKQDIVTKCREMGIQSTSFKDIYVVEPTNNESMTEGEQEDQEMLSAILDKALSQQVKGVNRRSATSDERARFVRKTFNDKGVTSKLDSVAKHNTDIVMEMAKYLSETCGEILSDLSHFCQDADGKWHSVLDKESLKLIKRDKNERKRYGELILNAKAIEKEFGLIKDVDIQSEDPNIQGYLNKIKSSIDSIRNSTLVNQAFELYAEKYLGELSKNPLIQQGMISILDGFWKSNWAESVFNDIQESPNPIIQVTMKEFMKDMRSAQMNARKRIDEFSKFMNDLRSEAAKNGKSIDFSHIIDEYGRFIQEYTDKFLEDRDRLQEDVRKAKEEFGENSVEHLKARLIYNEWKAENLEQPLKKEYYDEVNALERQILFGTPTEDEVTHRIINVGASPHLFAYYERLRRERNNILHSLSDDTPNPELDKRLDEINKELDLILGDFYYNEKTGTLEEKTETYGNTLEDAMKSYFHTDIINDYVEKRREIENKYYGRKAKFGFEEEVERNAKIVQSFEQRFPDAELQNKPDYIKAKTWLRRNTIRKPSVKGEWAKELQDAYETLGRKDDTDTTSTRNVLWDKTKTHGRIDEFGVFDARYMTDEEIDQLKAKETQQFRNHDDNPLSDRTLISNGAPDKTVYSREFYKGFTGGTGKDNAEWFKVVTEINDLLAPYYDSANERVNLQLIKNDKEGIETLRKLSKLYDRLTNINKTESKEDKKKRYKWIEENVEFAINEALYEADRIWAEGLPKDQFRTAILGLIKTVDANWNVGPNSFLYGYIKPKGETFKEYGTGKEIKSVDEKKTKALATIAKYTERVPTKYYSEKFYEMSQKGEEEFQKWFIANHIYNPYTHGYQPLRCWTSVKYGNDLSYDYYPSYAQKERYIRDGKYDENDPTQIGVTVNLTKEEQEKYEAKKKEGEDKSAYIKRLRDTADSVEAKGKHKAAKELRHLAEVAETGYDSKTDFVNKNYKEGGHGINYRRESHNYDRTINANEYELRARNHMREVLMSLAHTKESRNYLEKGWLPSRSSTGEHDLKYWAKQLAGLVGFETLHNGKEDFYEDIEYYKDRPIPMPMLNQVKGKGVVTNDMTYPKREDYDTEEEFIRKKEEYAAKQKEVDKQNLEIHKALHDKDYESVIKEFILKAAQYNAVQDNKYKLFLAQQLIRTHGTYIQKYKLSGPFKKDYAASNEEDSEYLRQADENLIKQFDKTINRMVYDQWKEPNNSLTRLFSVMQSYTSASFMMLNFKGGIANVTLGETQILAEAFAREYFNMGEYAKGKATYMQGIPDYIANMYNEKASTIQGAIIKFFDIVDYDEHNGEVDRKTDSSEIIKIVKAMGYAPQSSGEHAMQNAALFSMMYSHRLFENERAQELGQPSLMFMSFEEFTNKKHEEALLAILDETQRENYKLYKKKVAGDANLMKDFAWFKKNVTTEFALTYLNDEQQRAFGNKKQELLKDAKKEFEDDEKHPTIYSQMELRDGKMGFKSGSKLSYLDVAKPDGSPSDAIELMAEFKGRVISVNKKIHGVYDKSGRAALETTFWGSLLMQYHKHIPMAIAKRYRRQGMFNEERGTVEKGFYGSLYDYLAIPFRKHQNVLNLNNYQVQASLGVQNIIKETLNLLFTSKYYNMLPEYDRANLRRGLANTCAVLSSLFAAIAIQCIADDDDEDTWLYNMAVYQADRLATESTQFSVFGYAELKKQLQNPFAANTIFQDVLSSASMLAQMIIQGDEFDPTYKSGQFAGDNKLTVYLSRRIPIWRGIKSSFIDIYDNNHYYKVGKNLLGFVNADNIADEIMGD